MRREGLLQQFSRKHLAGGRRRKARVPDMLPSKHKKIIDLKGIIVIQNIIKPPN